MPEKTDETSSIVPKTEKSLVPTEPHKITQIESENSEEIQIIDPETFSEISDLEEESESLEESDEIEESEEEEKDEEYDFEEAFKNMYVPKYTQRKKIPYIEAFKCLESLGYQVITTEEEYIKTKGTSFLHAWCPLKHKICKVLIAPLVKNHNTGCKECGKIKTIQTNMIRYNAPNPMQNKSIRQKASQTCEDRHGYPNPMQNESIRQKAQQTCEDRHGFPFPLQNPEILAKARQTCEDRHGAPNPLQNADILAKQQATNIERYGSICSLQNEDVHKKTVATNMERYNTEFPNQNKEVQERTKQTNRERYDADYPMQNKEVQERTKQTNRERYDADYPLQSEEIRGRINQTNIDKYGSKCPLANKEIWEKAKETMMDKYDCENAMQNAELFKKQQEIAFSFKDYTLPSGKIVKYQGYEHFCYEELLYQEGIKESDLITLYNNEEQYPLIFYNFEGGVHRYFPDIYIPSQNRIIEVKSRYIYDEQPEMNAAKAKRCKDLGYNFEFRLYKKNGEIDEIIFP